MISEIDRRYIATDNPARAISFVEELRERGAIAAGVIRSVSRESVRLAGYPLHKLTHAEIS